MSTLTGAQGIILLEGVQIGSVGRFTANINRDAIEDTPVGVWDRTYVRGLRGLTANLSVFYNLDNVTAREFFNSIFLNADTTEELTFQFDTVTLTSLESRGFLTSLGASVAAGAAQTMDCQWQGTGPITGNL